MGDFWAESIRLASLVTERFLCLLGQGISRLAQEQHILQKNVYLAYPAPPQ